MPPATVQPFSSMGHFFIILILVSSFLHVSSFSPLNSKFWVPSSRVKVLSMEIKDTILRRVDKWACVKNCGACCKLGPLDSRPDLQEYLKPEEFVKYKSMIGDDDWCINFDKENRMCKIYDDRPDFCRVEPKKFKTMFGVEEEELNDFCAFCCREQISDTYGEDSEEMERFEDVIEALADEGSEGEGGFTLVNQND